MYIKSSHFLYALTLSVSCFARSITVLRESIFEVLLFPKIKMEITIEKLITQNSCGILDLF